MALYSAEVVFLSHSLLYVAVRKDNDSLCNKEKMFSLQYEKHQILQSDILSSCNNIEIRGRKMFHRENQISAWLIPSGISVCRCSSELIGPEVSSRAEFPPSATLGLIMGSVNHSDGCHETQLTSRLPAHL